MATKVSVVYTPSLNLSVTEKDGTVTRVTHWTTGVPRSTEVVVGLPAKRNARKGL